MNPKEIAIELTNYDLEKVAIYTNYLSKLQTSKNKDKTLKNPWMKYKTKNDLVSYFKAVAYDRMNFDGVHITLQSTGVSYDYVAYKNKMYLVYPESLIDTALVYADDSFRFEKQSGKVIYTHAINNPFNQDQNNIIGGYCVIKNKRGEFITLLSTNIIEKHRKVASTDTIWRAWFHEMCFKTLIKKACKQHFADIFQNIETLDNENYDLEQPLGVSIEDKAAVEKIGEVEELKKFWEKNKGRNAGVLKDFNKLISRRKEELLTAPEEETADDSIRQPGEE